MSVARRRRTEGVAKQVDQNTGNGFHLGIHKLPAAENSHEDGIEGGVLVTSPPPPPLRGHLIRSARLSGAAAQKLSSHELQTPLTAEGPKHVRRAPPHWKGNTSVAIHGNVHSQHCNVDPFPHSSLSTRSCCRTTPLHEISLHPEDGSRARLLARVHQFPIPLHLQRHSISPRSFPLPYTPSAKRTVGSTEDSNHRGWTHWSIICLSLRRPWVRCHHLRKWRARHPRRNMGQGQQHEWVSK